MRLFKIYIYFEIHISLFRDFRIYNKEIICIFIKKKNSNKFILINYTPSIFLC